jgi:hypothetical protein
MLQRMCGTCLTEYSFPWPATVAAYTKTPLYATLATVYEALRTFRGYDNFVKAKFLPPYDYYVPDKRFVIEFDEDQHFTHPRKVSLGLYENDVHLGFSRERWMALCEEYNAVDLEPAYRDEQRAWYDTLRDLVPPLHGLQPTIRLHAGDYPWCSLDPKMEADIALFQALLAGRMPGPITSIQGEVNEVT